MPDSNWTTLKGDAARRQEAELNGANDSLPPAGGKKWEREVDFDPPSPPSYSWTDPQSGQTQIFTAREWDCTRTMTFSLLSREGVSPPAAIPVTQYCSKCDGHSDSLVNSNSQQALGVPYIAADVNENQRGHRRGNLYQQYRIHGTVLKRIDRVTRRVPQGDGPQITIMQSDEPLNSLTWQRKTVDHIEKGPFIHWLTTMLAKNCKTGLSEPIGMHEDFAEHSLLLALRESGLDPSLPLLNDSGAIEDLLTSAGTLDEAAFQISWEEKKGFTIALANLIGENELQEVGSARLQTHDDSFCTIENWKSHGKKKQKKRS